MRAIGTMFMSKARPEITKGENDLFQLTLQLIDRLGSHEMQVYRVRWEGPEAQAFWAAHAKDLQAGAIVEVDLTRMRSYVGQTYPPLPELRARANSLKFVPRRTAADQPTAAHA